MSDIFLPPDVHYDAAAAFNISDIFTDAIHPSCFFQLFAVVVVVRVVAVVVIVVATVRERSRVINSLTRGVPHIV